MGSLFSRLANIYPNISKSSLRIPTSYDNYQNKMNGCGRKNIKKPLSNLALALTDYLSKHPVAEGESAHNYDKEFAINGMAPRETFISNFGSLSNGHQHVTNQTDQSQCEKRPKQTFGACSNGSSIESVVNDHNLKSAAIKSVSRINNSSKMDSKTIDKLERTGSSGETAELIERWRTIVKPGECQISGGRWKEYHLPSIKEMSVFE